MLKWIKGRKNSSLIGEVLLNIQTLRMILEELMDELAVHSGDHHSKLDKATERLGGLNEIMMRALSFRNLTNESRNALTLLQSYTVIVQHEFSDFVKDNADRILRAANWCEETLTKERRRM